MTALCGEVLRLFFRPFLSPWTIAARLASADLPGASWLVLIGLAASSGAHVLFLLVFANSLLRHDAAS
jgi:hypothetical protein